MPPSALNTKLKNSPEEYFDDIRFQVTRHFCIFCFVLAMLAIPSSFFAKDRTTLIINATALLLYVIPLVISTKTKKYVMAARIYICIAMVLLVANAIAANFDISLATTAWYFVYLVFAYLVLNFAWAVAVGIVAVTSFSVFATLRLLGLHALNPHLSQDSITIGSMVTMIVALVALLYLLTVYKRLRDVIFREIVASDKEKSQLVGIMSHDMRNYLGAVQGIASLIQDDMESCSNKMVAQETISKTALIDQATANALQMVEEVVAVARDTVGNKIYMEKVVLADFITPIFHRYQLLARSKGIKLLLESEGKEMKIAVNKDRFSRAIENLLSNAIKFSRESDTISIAAKPADGNVIISVTDTGIGIPEEMKDKIFEPFTNAGRVGTANEKTIGLGMSIVKKTVEQHGGAIWFESTVGKGTAFFVKLAVVSE